MRQLNSRVTIHAGPQLKGSLLRYLSTVRVPRPFKDEDLHWAGCTFYSFMGARGNVFGKQSEYVFAEFLIERESGEGSGSRGGLWALRLRG